MSTIKANDIQNASGGIPTVKGQRLIPTAWVFLQGTTNTIHDSENVSSMTDLGTGQHRINFAIGMANTTYAVATSGSTNRCISTDTYSHLTTSVVLESKEVSSGNTIDAYEAQAIILGGQA